MSPESREVAKLSNEILSVGRRLRNLAKRLDWQNAMQQKLLRHGLQEIKDRM